jgi:hypothetical protein
MAKIRAAELAAVGIVALFVIVVLSQMSSSNSGLSATKVNQCYPPLPISYVGQITSAGGPSIEYFTAFGGGGMVSGVESDVQIRAFAATFCRLRVVVASNTASGPIYVMLRRNGGDTSLSVTIPAGQTGVFLNDHDTATFSANDLIDMKLDWTNSAVGTGTGVITLRSFQYE